MVSWARLVAPAALAVSLAGCGLGYGASFDFPEAAPLPAGTTVLATDTGSDDDDPLRSRQQVIDLGTTTQTRFLSSYRDAYPASEGWEESKASSDQQLCLVNHRSSPAFVEVVEVEEYVGLACRRPRRVGSSP